MIQGILSALGFSQQRPGLWSARHQQRIAAYIRYKRLFDGYAVRQSTDHQDQFKQLRYNLSRPIANVAADFLAAKEISWVVNDEDELTATCDEIWTQSGGSATFIENARLGGIMGDACIMIDKPEEDKVAKFKWLDPAVCYPEFDPHDYTKMIRLVIAYDILDSNGKSVVYSEVWENGKVTVKMGDDIIRTETYDEEVFGGIPAVWIRNDAMKGDMFGRSDLQGIVELVEEYDHLNTKQSRIIDYYAAPNLKAKGVTKNQMTMQKGERTMYFIPAEADIEFIEWGGTAPTIDLHLARVRETISEVAETPQVAFSKVDSGISNVSGVALRILYGPLIAKTERKRQSWGPSMERAMWMALRCEGHMDLELDEISIEWQDPTPVNEVEEWEIYAHKVEMGVSKKQVLREAGYTDDEIDQFTEEAEEEQAAMAEQLMKEFNAGNTGAYPSPGKPKPPGGGGKPPAAKPKAPPK
jgi:hypothetical protein